MDNCKGKRGRGGVRGVRGGGGGGREREHGRSRWNPVSVKIVLRKSTVLLLLSHYCCCYFHHYILTLLSLLLLCHCCYNNNYYYVLALLLLLLLLLYTSSRWEHQFASVLLSRIDHFIITCIILTLLLLLYITIMIIIADIIRFCWGTNRIGGVEVRSLICVSFVVMHLSLLFLHASSFFLLLSYYYNLTPLLLPAIIRSSGARIGSGGRSEIINLHPFYYIVFIIFIIIIIAHTLYSSGYSRAMTAGGIWWQVVGYAFVVGGRSASGVPW